MELLKAKQMLLPLFIYLPISSGSSNTAIGNYSLNNLKAGSGNTALGIHTGRGIETGSNNTILGANVRDLAADLSNTVIIADVEGNQRIYVDDQGNTGLGTTNPTETLSVNGTAQITGALKDSDGDAGTAAQILATTANGTNWVDAPSGSSGSSSRIADADNDTFIDAEASADADQLIFNVSGAEHFRMKAGGRLDVLNSGNSVFIGNNAGLVDNLNNNQNVAIGSGSLQKNI